MSSRICKDCHVHLEEKTKFFVCPVCGYSEKKYEWYTELLNESYWWEPVFTDYPTIIKIKYQSMRDNIQKGQVPASWLMIRDLFEMTLKLPFILLVCEGIHRKTPPYDVIRKLTAKPLSLGTWEATARQYYFSMENKYSSEAIILGDILEIYKKKSFTTWRNDKIGHGAFSIQDLELTYRQDLVDLLSAIRDHFKNNEDHYRNLNVESIDGKLYLMKETEKIALFPLLNEVDNNINIFDAYYIQNNKTAFLDYLTAKKRKNLLKEMKDLYKAAKTFGEISAIDFSTESDWFSSRYLDILENIENSYKIYDFSFLKRELLDFLHTYHKGIFLLEMEGGMGKTTFVRSLDPFSKGKRGLGIEVEIRTFYINNTYANTPQYFAMGLMDILRRETDDSRVMGKTMQPLQPFSPSIKQEIANMLKDFSSYYGKKLLLIIDGLDEIPVHEKMTIFDMLPSEDMLKDDVFLMLTTRPSGNTTQFITKKIEKIKKTRVLSITSDDREYHELLYHYVKNNFQLKDEEEITQILSITENKFLSVDFLRRTYYELQAVEKNLQDGKAVMNRYFDVLSKYYTEMYFRDLGKMLVVLACSPQPLTMKEISTLIGYDELNFKLLYYLAELKGIWQKENSYKNNLFSLQRSEYREWIIERFDEILLQLCQEWFDVLNEITVDHVNHEKLTYVTFLIYTLDQFSPISSDHLVEANGWKEIEEWIYAVLPNYVNEEKYQEYQIIKLMDLMARILQKAKGSFQERRAKLLTAKIKYIMDAERSAYFLEANTAADEAVRMIRTMNINDIEVASTFIYTASYIKRTKAFLNHNVSEFTKEQEKLFHAFPDLVNTREGVEVRLLDYLIEMKEIRNKEDYEYCILVAKEAIAYFKKFRQTYPDGILYYVQYMTYIASCYRHLAVKNKDMMMFKHLKKSKDYYEKLHEEINRYMTDFQNVKVGNELQKRKTATLMEISMVYKLLGNLPRALALIEELLSHIEEEELMGLVVDEIRKLKVIYNRSLIFDEMRQYEKALADARFVEKQLVVVSKKSGVTDHQLYKNNHLLLSNLELIHREYEKKK